MVKLFYKFRILCSVLICLVFFFPTRGQAEPTSGQAEAKKDQCEAVKKLSSIAVLQDRYRDRPIKFSENEISKDVDKCWWCTSIDSGDCDPSKGFANNFGQSLAELAIEFSSKNKPDKLHELLYFTDTALAELNKDDVKSYAAIVKTYNSFAQKLKNHPGTPILDQDQLKSLEEINLDDNAQASANKAISDFFKYVSLPAHNNISKNKCTAVETLVDMTELRQRIFKTDGSDIIKTEADQSDIELQKCWEYEIGCGEKGKNACAVKLGTLLAEIAVEHQENPKKLKRVAVVIKNTLQKFLEDKYYLTCVSVYNTVSSQLNTHKDSLKGILRTANPLLNSVEYDTNAPRKSARLAVDSFSKSFPTLQLPMGNGKNREDGKTMLISYGISIFLLLYIAIIIALIYLVHLVKNIVHLVKSLKQWIETSEILKNVSLQNPSKQNDKFEKSKQMVDNYMNEETRHPFEHSDADNMQEQNNMNNNSKSQNSEKQIPQPPKKPVERPRGNEIYTQIAVLEDRIAVLEDRIESYRRFFSKKTREVSKNFEKNISKSHQPAQAEISTEDTLLEIERELFRRKKANIESNDAIREKIQEIHSDKDFIRNAFVELPKLISDPALKARYQNLSQALNKYVKNFMQLENILKYKPENFKTEKDEIVELRLWSPLLDRLENEDYMRYLSEFDIKKWVEQKFIIFADAFLIEYQKALSEGKAWELQEAYDTTVSILGKAEIEPLSVLPKKDYLNKEFHILRSRAAEKDLPDEIIVSVVKSGFTQAGQILNKAEVIVNKNG